MNQSTGEKKDRNGGGDVTKAEKIMEVDPLGKTTWDQLNATGEGRFDSKED